MTAPEASADLISAQRHEFEILSPLALPGVCIALDLVRIGDGLGLVLQEAGSGSLLERRPQAPSRFPSS